MATNMTTAAGNNTNNTTASPTIAATTATPTTITTVGTLPSSVSNSDCKTGKLCAAEPSSCNPSGARSCFFLSAKQNNGQSFDFELSGESNGYIAATLSTDSSLGGNDSTYVCANNNSAVKFIGASLDNGQLTQTDLSGSNVRGNISGNRIQCTFTATVSNTAVRAASFAVGISTGPFNSTSGTLGNPVFVFRSSVINLQNVNTTVNNEITNHAITFQLSLMQALLISVGVLGLSMQ
ncbi:putative ferric-chelate reductase 1 [Morone saxatilis]|uniref:putative ferric-chelate reductase 1 n=1 Tax=Morone saxatilis TaxID=34816 RepID=UPI0015E23C7F|nr:putative ferric-chelate reductase 1 [Morone saxatilis]XP_035530877.1 putative ferric-chelate reductase 1 [Morone saxatilis]